MHIAGSCAIYVHLSEDSKEWGGRKDELHGLEFFFQAKKY